MDEGEDEQNSEDGHDTADIKCGLAYLDIRYLLCRIYSRYLLCCIYLHGGFAPVQHRVDVGLVRGVGAAALDVGEVGHHVHEAEQLGVVHVQHAPRSVDSGLLWSYSARY